MLELNLWLGFEEEGPNLGVGVDLIGLDDFGCGAQEKGMYLEDL